MQYRIYFSTQVGVNERSVLIEGCSSLDAQRNFERTISAKAYKRITINEIKPLREKNEPYELPVIVETDYDEFLLRAAAKIHSIVKAKAAEFIEDKVEVSMQESIQELLKLVWNNGYNSALKIANKIIEMQD